MGKRARETQQVSGVERRADGDGDGGSESKGGGSRTDSGKEAAAVLSMICSEEGEWSVDEERRRWQGGKGRCWPHGSRAVEMGKGRPMVLAQESAPTAAGSGLALVAQESHGTRLFQPHSASISTARWTVHLSSRHGNRGLVSGEMIPLVGLLAVSAFSRATCLLHIYRPPLPLSPLTLQRRLRSTVQRVMSFVRRLNIILSIDRILPPRICDLLRPLLHKTMLSYTAHERTLLAQHINSYVTRHPFGA